ncbi:ATP-dependent Clp protease proteolytic subunit [Sphingobium sp. H33]|uniref:ATP-dependent Clp protease proteolytic subunit n=1 Tax=Sphingobium nicotianae TaxID=2782607 RepID=A0A9X1DFJ2_9SPHN|nr:ATP-dependent Clp protease proteolytic subunit [Sphingobium nicotianae]
MAGRSPSVASLSQYPKLAYPHIRLNGPVDLAMYNSFRSVMNNPPADEIVIALTTLGGDPEVARVMGEDIRLFGEQTGNNALFLGKVAVYSAGATFMSYFRRENRFLTHGTRILIHERQLHKTVELGGPLRACADQLRATLNEIEESIRIEEEGFANLIVQSNIPIEDVRQKAPHNWYLDAEEAMRLGLVLDVI